MVNQEQKAQATPGRKQGNSAEVGTQGHLRRLSALTLAAFVMTEVVPQQCGCLSEYPARGCQEIVREPVALQKSGPSPSPSPVTSRY